MAAVVSRSEVGGHSQYQVTLNILLVGSRAPREYDCRAPNNWHNNAYDI